MTRPGSSAFGVPRRKAEPSRRRQASRGLVGSLLSASTGLLATLIVIPVALHALGSERYGLWVVLWQLIGYLNILDLGVAYAATRDLAAAHAAGDRRVIAEVVASGFYLYAGLGIAFFALGWILLPLLPLLTHDAQGTMAAARWPLLLMLAHGLLGFPTRFLASANVGAQAIAASGVVGLVQGLTNIAVAVLLLRTGAGLIALPLGIIASDLIAMALHGIIFARVYGFKTLRPSGIRAAAVRRLLVFGLPLLVTGMAWTIVSGTDSIVISARLGLAAVALFAVSYRIPSQLVQLVNLGVDVTMPGLTGVMTVESAARRSETYAELLRLVGVFAGVCAAGVLVLLRPFMLLWVGPDQTAGVALVVVMAYLIVHHPVQHVLGVVMVAARDVRALAVVTMVEALTNLGLSLVAVGVFGVPGVLYATATAGWINVGYGLWKSARLTGLSPGAILAAAFGNASLAIGIGVATGLLIGLSGFGGSWGSFLLGAGAWGAITLIGLAIVDRLLLRGRLRTTVRSLLNAARSGRAPLAPAIDSI